MSVQPITYKQQLDSEGDFTKLEVWQGNNCIVLSLASPELNGMTPALWHNVRATIDGIQAAIQEKAATTIYDDFDPAYIKLLKEKAEKQG